MMSATAPKPVTTPIPVQLSEPEFATFILPHLSMPKRWPKCKLGYYRVFNLILWVLYTGMQWKCLPVPTDANRTSAIHSTTVYKVFAKWADDGVALAGVHRQCAASGGRETARYQCAPWRRDQHRGQKRGDGIGYSGHKHQKGEKVIAIIDNPGYVLAPVPGASVNEPDMVLLPQGLNALKQVAQQIRLDLRSASLNLDGGFDSAHHRKGIFNTGVIPNIKENPHNRKPPKRGRKRFFNAAIHALRMRVERTFAWADKFKRLLIRFERIQQRHYGMQLRAYTLINLRAFCGI